MAYSRVSGFPTAETTLTNNPATATGTLNAVGDLVWAFGRSGNSAQPTLTLTTSAGPGAVDSWRFSSFWDSGASVMVWLAWGVVTVTGSITASVAITGGGSATSNGIGLDSITAGLGAGTVWAADGAAGTLANASSTDVPLPHLTPTRANDIYVGFSRVANSVTGLGATVAPVTGWTSSILGGTSNGLCVNIAGGVSSGVAAFGDQTQSAGVSTTIALLLNATSGTPPPDLGVYEIN